MSKLQKYNQIILALAGTLIVGFALFTGAFALYSVFSRDISDRNVIQTEQKLQADIKAGVRTQKATFQPITNYYDWSKDWTWSAIEVRVKTLAKPERLAGISGPSMGSRSNDFRVRHSDLTNILLWNSESDQNHLVFKNRVKIRNAVYLGNKDFEHILLEARSLADEAYSLFLYSVDSNALTKLSLGGLINPRITSEATGTNQPIVYLGIDENGNGAYDNEQEIKIPFKVNLATKELTPLVPMAVFQQAQSILEGGTTGDK